MSIQGSVTVQVSSTGPAHPRHKSLRVYPALTETLVQDCHQSPTRQLHFDSPWPELPLLVGGHSPTNALGKNNGTEAQLATVPLQQAYTDRDPDLSNDLALWALPSKVLNHDPKADSSLCEYPGPGSSSLEQCIPEYSLSESEQALSSSDTCSSQELFYSFEQCSAGCYNSMSISEDYLGSYCQGQSLLCDHSPDDHSGLLSHGWSPSQSGLSGSMGHNKTTQCYGSSGFSDCEVSQKVFSQSSIDVVPLNGIRLVYVASDQPYTWTLANNYQLYCVSYSPPMIFIHHF